MDNQKLLIARPANREHKNRHCHINFWKKARLVVIRPFWLHLIKLDTIY